MRIYFAPLEGITGYTYRNVFHEFFGEEIDKYYTPFIATAKEGCIKHRSLRDIQPENNEGLTIVPQILSNNAEDFIVLTRHLNKLGYREINFNLGCPYGTVTAKGKGSGFLVKKEELVQFFDRVFEECDCEISVKTRIGMESADEWEELLDIYNKYPIKELTVHPRIRQDFYANKPNMEAFELAVKKSANPLCYNGDIFTKADYEDFIQKYPQVESIMIGRGFLINPGLLREIEGGSIITKKEIIDFHDRIYHDYLELIKSDKNTLFKMKELWNYWQYLFESTEDEKTVEKYLKQIRKAQRGSDYKAAVRGLFAACEIKKQVRIKM